MFLKVLIISFGKKKRAATLFDYEFQMGCSLFLYWQSITKIQPNAKNVSEVRIGEYYGVI